MATLIRKKNGRVNVGATVERAVADAGNDASLAYAGLSLYVGPGGIEYWTHRDGRGQGPMVPREPGKEIAAPYSYKLPEPDRRTMQEQCLAQCRAIAAGDKKPQPQQSSNGNAPVEPEPVTVTVDPDTGNFVSEPEPVEPEPTPEPEPVPPADPFTELDEAIERLRAFADEREGLKGDLDSMRVSIDANKLLRADLPLAGILSDMTCEWTQATREQAGVSEFDWAVWVEANKMSHVGEFDHVIFPVIHAKIGVGIPCYIWGGAGTGKSFGVKKSAEILGLDYYETNLSAQTGAAVTGRDRLKEFVESSFTKAYRDGGIWNGEEFDNSAPQVATIINNAIAGDEFWNPVSGEMIKRHPDFRIVLTANTLGTGAANGYLRQAQDKATLDRFRLGRTKAGLDRRLEANIVRAAREGAGAR